MFSWWHRAIAFASISWLYSAVGENTVFFPSILWSTTNPGFESECPCPSSRSPTFHLNVPPMTKLYIVCPNPGLILSKLQNNVPNDLLHENLIMVEKEDFDDCRYNMSKPRETTRILMNCTHDPNGPLQFFLLVFQELSAEQDDIKFKPNHTYYFISTSDGTKDSLINNRGPGHCNDSKNSLAMKLEVYVCRDEEDCKKEDKKLYKCPECPVSSSLSSSSISPTRAASSSHWSPTTTTTTTTTLGDVTFSSVVSSPSSRESIKITTESTTVSLAKISAVRSPGVQPTVLPAGRVGNQKSDRTFVVWLVVVILLLVISLILNLILFIKCKDEKKKECGAKYNVYVDGSHDGTLPNGSNAHGIFTNKTYSMVSEQGDTGSHDGHETIIGLKCPSTETISEEGEEKKDIPKSNGHCIDEKLI